MGSDALWLGWFVTFWLGVACGCLIGRRTLRPEQRQELRDYRSVFGDPE